MLRFLKLAATIVTLVLVMLLAAGITLRLALHGGEVAIPDLAGLSVAEASDAAISSGLDLNIENKFYSTTVPAGRILSQAPAAGSRVRKGWQVRVTESLGPQKVTIPDVSGEPVRQASMGLRRTSLDLGNLAHIDAPGDPEVVLTQTPPPNAGVDQPRVSLLLSSATGTTSTAYVLPSFIGLSAGAANRLALQLGLRLTVAGNEPPTPTPTPATAPASTTTPPAAPPAPTPTPTATVVAQSPDSGHRIARGDTLHLTLSH